VGALIPEVKWPGREADLSHPYSAEVKKVRSYTSTPLKRLHGMTIKHRDKINFTIPLPNFLLVTALAPHSDHFMNYTFDKQ